MSRDLSYLGLPAEITAAVEMHPVEDIALQVLRDRFPTVQVNSMIEFDQSNLGPFFILVRRIPGWGTWSGDSRFLDSAGLAVHVFAKDPDADEKGAIISEACRVALRDAALKATYYPGLGGLVKAGLITEPSRRTDWATSSGPVQFADLPGGYQRYEARFQLTIRRPLWG